MKLKTLSAAFVLTLVTSAAHDAGAWPDRGFPGRGEHHSVPELNMKGAASALALLVGGVLVLAGRRKRSA